MGLLHPSPSNMEFLSTYFMLFSMKKEYFTVYMYICIYVYFYIYIYNIII